MWGYNHATILKTYHLYLYNQFTNLLQVHACESTVTKAAAEERSTAEGGARVRKSWIRGGGGGECISH